MMIPNRHYAELKDSYLFYHTDNEETGSHIFSETYEEHQSTR